MTSRTFWTLVGALIGALIGLLIGGVGIAARGSAIGAPGWFVFLLFAFAGGFLGRRLGRPKDEPSN